MPIFNINNALKTSTMSVPFGFGDEEVFNVLTGKDSDTYISAKEALKNSDIYSAIFQLSGDLASSQIISSKTRYQGIIDNPTLTSNKSCLLASSICSTVVGWRSFYISLAKR